jgi:hypothetical protein
MTHLQPTPAILAKLLRDLAGTIEADGKRALVMLELLAARGWPNATLGDGGASNGASLLVVDADTGPDGERVPVTSTEAAALHADRWAGKDTELRKLTRHLAHVALRVDALIHDALAHGTTDDPVPAGVGTCEACDHFCNPKKNPDDRLKGKLCPACYIDRRRKQADLSYDEWLLVRRQLKGHTEGAVALTHRFGGVYGQHLGYTG